MRNYRNNKRRFRSNSFDRNLKFNSNDNNINAGFGNVSDFKRRNYPRNNFNSSKLIQKYSNLAREALSIGDKILSENYLQHAEHFIRLSDNTSNNLNSSDSPSSNYNAKQGDAAALNDNDSDLSKTSGEKSKQEDQFQEEKNQ